MADGDGFVVGMFGDDTAVEGSHGGVEPNRRQGGHPQIAAYQIVAAPAHDIAFGGACLAVAIDADDEDASYAIGAILALGAIGLFSFPAIGHALHMKDHAFGLWAGLAIDNTAEVTAAGNMYSEEAGKWAVLAKTARNATIGFVVLGVAAHFAARAGKRLEGSRAGFLWSKFPKFVLGFVVISALASARAFSPGQVASLANLSRWAFLLTFAGVGLKTNFAELRRQGLRPLIVGAIGEVAIAALTLAMVVVTDKVFPL